MVRKNFSSKEIGSSAYADEPIHFLNFLNNGVVRRHMLNRWPGGHIAKHCAYLSNAVKQHRLPLCNST